MFSSCQEFESNTKFVRKNIHSPEAQSDVDAMNKALQSMRKLDCSNPLSWYYQGAIHWIPDTIKDNKLCNSYKNISDKKDGWDNCTHSHTSVDEVNFLVWHRLYIWHFEKIVRKLSGKKDFALPYWGYTNKGTENLTLHQSFIDKSSSLYESSRFDSLNQGCPMEGEIQRTFNLSKLMSYTDFQLFASNIDRAPHGAIHDYVGHGNDYNDGKLWFDNSITGTKTHDGLMGWVPTAAFDPVFWTHHSNIDRIWQQWSNSANGRPITVEMLKQNPWSYAFFDENGKKVVYTPEQIIDIIYSLDYDFDDCQVRPVTNPVLVKSSKRNKVSQKVGLDVNSQITDAITIKSPVSSTGQFPGKVEIEVEVSFTDLPRGVYEVYVNHNKSIEPNPSNNSFVGFMTFFGQDHKSSGTVCLNGCCTPLINGRPSMKFKFQVDQSSEYNFIIYKHNGNHSGDLRIENINILF